MRVSTRSLGRVPNGRLTILLLCIGHVLFFSHQANSQSISVGIRFQKSINFYLENGVSGYFECDSLLSGKLLLGAHLISSRLGTALGSNAIKQESIFLSSHFIHRKNKDLNVLTGMNLGYFHANYEEDIFDDLDNRSVIMAFDGGLRYHIHPKINTHLSLGYNFISGNGENGAGTLYPFYYQISLLWLIEK